MAIKKHTKNGEITYDTESKLYTVWDETYTHVVCSTPYPLVAEGALKIYANNYV